MVLILELKAWWSLNGMNIVTTRPVGAWRHSYKIEQHMREQAQISTVCLDSNNKISIQQVITWITSMENKTSQEDRNVVISFQDKI